MGDPPLAQAVRGPNPVLATRRLVAGREDHLTEFFAAVLGVDAPVRDAFVARLLAVGEGETLPTVREVRTQVAFPGTGCVPDLQLTLDDGRRVLVEVKLDALETAGVADDGSVLGQLERYLELPVDGVAYIRTALNAPPAHVLNHPKYLAPAAGPHHLWRDVYPDLLDAETALGRWMREAFEHWGFVPPHNDIGDLHDPDPVVRARNRENFSKLWTAARHRATALGWGKTETGSRIELYIARHPNALARRLHINPAFAERLVVRAFPHVGSDAERIEERWRTIGAVASRNPDLLVGEVRGERACVLALPLSALVGDARGAAELEAALADFVAELLEPLASNPRAP